MINSETTFEPSREGMPSEQPKRKALRYGLSLPLAAVATIGLTVSMASLIATEFTPQDKTETANYEINPRVDDIPDVVRTERPDPLREVETPPPPPTIDTYQTVAVDLPIIEVTRERTVFKMDRLNLKTDFNVTIDKDPTPLVRIPPVFPNRFLQGNVSGYCRVRFDISPEGLPFNVQTTTCTNNQLKSATVKSVQKWKYAPEMRDGIPVSRSGLETTIRFDLRGDRGEVLPLPSGY